jgi:hypothetical protein
LYIGSTESLKGDDWKDFSTRFKAIAIEKPSPRIRLSKRLQKSLKVPKSGTGKLKTIVSERE